MNENGCSYTPRSGTRQRDQVSTRILGQNHAGRASGIRKVGKGRRAPTQDPSTDLARGSATACSRPRSHRRLRQPTCAYAHESAHASAHVSAHGRARAHARAWRAHAYRIRRSGKRYAKGFCKRYPSGHLTKYGSITVIYTPNPYGVSFNCGYAMHSMRQVGRGAGSAGGWPTCAADGEQQRR